MSIFAQGITARHSMDGADSALEGSSMGRLAAVLGEPAFATALLALMRKYADVDQLALFALDESSGFEPIFNTGSLLAPQAAARLSRLYCRKYFLLDPLFDRVARYGNDKGASTEVHNGKGAHTEVHNSAASQPDPLRRYLGFGAKCSLIFEKNGQTYYLSLYRRPGSPHFSDAECSMLEQLAPPLRRLIHAHHRLMHESGEEAWPRQAAMNSHDCRSAEQLFFSMQYLLARDEA